MGFKGGWGVGGCFFGMGVKKRGGGGGGGENPAPPGRPPRGGGFSARPAAATTRFMNLYDADHTRRQVVTARADDVELRDLPDEWRCPEALLLGPVAGELSGFPATAFEAGRVGALAQGRLRQLAPDRPGPPPQ